MSSRHQKTTWSSVVLRSLIWALAAVFLAAVLGRVITALPMIGDADLGLVVAVNHGLGPVAGPAAQAVDMIFGPPVAVVILVLAVVGCAVLRRSLRAGVRLGALIIPAWAVAELLKMVVRRPRPDAEFLTHHLVATPDSFSYPSGHTAFAAALCCGILLMLRPGRGRQVGIVLAVVVVAITAWSRVALGVHYPTDVLASAILVPFLGLLVAPAVDATLDAVLPARPSHSTQEDDVPGHEEAVIDHG